MLIFFFTVGPIVVVRDYINGGVSLVEFIKGKEGGESAL